MHTTLAFFDRSRLLPLWIFVLFVAPLDSAQAVSFQNIAEGGGAGIVYSHQQYAPRWDARLEILQQSQVVPISLMEVAGTPMFHPTGKSATVLIDYDSDGDTRMS